MTGKTLTQDGIRKLLTANCNGLGNEVGLWQRADNDQLRPGEYRPTKKSDAYTVYEEVNDASIGYMYTDPSPDDMKMVVTPMIKNLGKQLSLFVIIMADSRGNGFKDASACIEAFEKHGGAYKTFYIKQKEGVPPGVAVCIYNKKQQELLDPMAIAKFVS